MGPGYSPFTPDPSSSGYSLSSVLGIVYDPGNPLFSGLTLANVGTSYQGDVGLDPGATLVASWDSGRRAIGYRNLPSSRIVDLNLFPDGSSLNTDTQHLVANAIDYSLFGGAPPIPEPGSISLLAIGALGLAAFARRKHLV